MCKGVGIRQDNVDKNMLKPVETMDTTLEKSLETKLDVDKSVLKVEQLVL